MTVDSGALTIQAERTPAYRESQQVIVAERSQGSFARQLSLGEGVDSENLTAAYTDGVLHVTIPASPRTQPRKVEITHTTGTGRTISGSTVEQGDGPVPNAGNARRKHLYSHRQPAVQGRTLSWGQIGVRSSSPGMVWQRGFPDP